MQVTFWGTRGSVPSPGAATVRYGGNTSCVEVTTDNGTLIICDGGTGLRELGVDLMARGKQAHGHVLFSHTHWDHIQGWPFFEPAFVKGNEFTLHALGGLSQSLEHVLANQMEFSFFPVTLDAMAATISFEEIHDRRITIEGVTVGAHYLNHTTICLAYRLEADGKTVVYASDTEPHALAADPVGPTEGENAEREPRFHNAQDRRLAEFVDGADLLILDAQYTDEEYPDKMGWGHSTTSYATDIGVLGKVGRLALFHHDPGHSDETVDRIVAQARRRAASYGSEMDVFGAAERLTVHL